MHARFNPSPYSFPAYGADEATASTTTTSEDPQATADSVGMAISIGKSILGWGDDSNNPDYIQAQISNYQRKYDNLPAVLRPTVGSVYLDNINKLKAKLVAAQEAKADAERNEQIYMAMKVGGVIAVFAGVVVIGGLAMNQIQRARRQQVEIERLQEGK